MQIGLKISVKYCYIKQANFSLLFIVSHWKTISVYIPFVQVTVEKHTYECTKGKLWRFKNEASFCEPLRCLSFERLRD